MYFLKSVFKLKKVENEVTITFFPLSVNLFATDFNVINDCSLDDARHGSWIICYESHSCAQRKISCFTVMAF